MFPKKRDSLKFSRLIRIDRAVHRGVNVPVRLGYQGPQEELYNIKQKPYREKGPNCYLVDVEHQVFAS